MPVRVVDRGAKALVQRLLEKARELRVGVVGPAAQEPHAGDEGKTVAMVAVEHEFGLGVPRRSFIRDTFLQKRRELRDRLRLAARRVFKGRLSTERALALLGEELVKDVRKRIDASIPPPNAPSTIQRKGSEVPLRDTDQLYNSIDWTLEGRR